MANERFAADEDIVGELVEARRAAVGEGIGFEPAPEIFHGVVLGSVGRRIFDMQPGMTSEELLHLGAAMRGQAVPEQDDWTDHEIKHASLADLKQLLQIRGQPQLVTVRRHRRAMPQYKLAYLDCVVRIEQLVARLSGFAFAGNAYRGGGVAHCIHSGELAAERIAAQLEQLTIPQTVRS